jgi:hypothetical protein
MTEFVKERLTRIPPSLPPQPVQAAEGIRFQQTFKADLFVRSVPVDATANVQISLPAHNHAIFQNAGTATIRFSKTGDPNDWWDWLDPNVIQAMDGHRDTLFYVTTAVNATVLRIQTWSDMP